MYDFLVSDLDDFVYNKLKDQDKIIIPEKTFQTLANLKDDQKAGRLLFAAIRWQMTGEEPAELDESEKLSCSLLADAIGIFGPKE